MTRVGATRLERDVASIATAVERIERTLGQRVLALENELVTLRAEVARYRSEASTPAGSGLVRPDGLT